MFLVQASQKLDPARIEIENPELWREIRRFNLPVKLALAAAHEAASVARGAKDALLVALAPCRPGSPELWRAAHAFETALIQTGRPTEVRVNPTYTLHAIDNLGISALALAVNNRAPGIGIGGSQGQAWCALELVLERFQDGLARETILFAGDQDEEGKRAAGVAVLFSAEPRSFGETDKTIRLLAVRRRRMSNPSGETRPDAVGGLIRWLGALQTGAPGRFAYEVPARDDDGVDSIIVDAEVS